jgi:hypothetical protein
MTTLSHIDPLKMFNEKKLSPSVWARGTALAKAPSGVKYMIKNGSTIIDC